MVMPRSFSAVGKGLFAGIVGTAAMTAAQTVAQKVQSSGTAASSGPADPWAEAPAPARVAKRIGHDILGVDVSPDLIPAATQAMHWAYGISWGVLYGVANRRVGSRKPDARRGMRFGLVVWAMSYAQLVPLGIYEPPWRYPVTELATDLGYHVAYGLGTVSAFHL
jgi:hypothetical protein